MSTSKKLLCSLSLLMITSIPLIASTNSAKPNANAANTSSPEATPAPAIPSLTPAPADTNANASSGTTDATAQPSPSRSAADESTASSSSSSAQGQQPPVATAQQTPQHEKPIPVAVVPAVAPVRVIPVNPPVKDGLVPAFKVGAVKVTPYGFIKATAAHDSQCSQR